MSTRKEVIAKWFDEGVRIGATHMMVVCDSFDYEDYPVFVRPDQRVEEIADSFHLKNMQKVMEVYDLGMSVEAQLQEERAFHGWKPQTS